MSAELLVHHRKSALLPARPGTSTRWCSHTRAPCAARPTADPSRRGSPSSSRRAYTWTRLPPRFLPPRRGPACPATGDAPAASSSSRPYQVAEKRSTPRARSKCRPGGGRDVGIVERAAGDVECGSAEHRFLRTIRCCGSSRVWRCRARAALAGFLINVPSADGRRSRRAAPQGVSC